MLKTIKKINIEQKLFNNYYLILISSIFLTTLIISFSILYVTGGFLKITNAILTPFKIANYGTLKEIANYTELSDIIESQPKISYNANAKYILVESSDLDCPNCANFHISKNKNANSSFEKLFKDFILTGDINYVFLDLNIIKGPDKHIASYCAAEQNPKKFFEYHKVVYENYGQDFNTEKALIYSNKVGLNVNEFKNCYESQRYKNRVIGLTNFNSQVLGITKTPVFTIFKVEKKEALNQNDQKTTWLEYTKVNEIVGNVNYETTIYPLIKEILKSDL